MLFAIVLLLSLVAAVFDEISATKQLIELYEAKIELVKSQQQQEVFSLKQLDYFAHQKQ